MRKQTDQVDLDAELTGAERLVLARHARVDLQLRAVRAGRRRNEQNAVAHLSTRDDELGRQTLAPLVCVRRQRTC